MAWLLPGYAGAPTTSGKRDDAAARAGRDRLAAAAPPFRLHIYVTLGHHKGAVALGESTETEAAG